MKRLEMKWKAIVEVRFHRIAFSCI